MIVKRVAKYIRVSTDLQDFSRQEDGLNEFISRQPHWTLFGSYDDVKSGKSDQREGFRRMMNCARAHQFQVLDLVLPHRHEFSPVDQDVSGLQYGVREQASVDVLRLIA